VIWWMVGGFVVLAAIVAAVVGLHVILQGTRDDD
jgi:hypothetical protein